MLAYYLLRKDVILVVVNPEAITQERIDEISLVVYEVADKVVRGFIEAGETTEQINARIEFAKLKSAKIDELRIDKIKAFNEMLPALQEYITTYKTAQRLDDVERMILFLEKQVALQRKNFNRLANVHKMQTCL